MKRSHLRMMLIAVSAFLLAPMVVLDSRALAVEPVWRPVGTGRKKVPPPPPPVAQPAEPAAAEPPSAPAEPPPEAAAAEPAPTEPAPDAAAPAATPPPSEPAPAPPPASVAAPAPEPKPAEPEPAQVVAPPPAIPEPAMPATPVFAQPAPPPPAPTPVVEPAPAPPARAVAAPATPVTPKKGAKVAPVAPPPAPVAAAAAARLPPAEGPISWPSMARAKEARALPASSPMTTELEPLPAPAGYGRPPDTEADRQQAAIALAEPAPEPEARPVAPPPPPAPTKPASPVSSHGSSRKAAPAKREAKGAPAVATPRTATAAPVRRGAPAAEQPAVAAPTFEAPPRVEGAATEPPPKNEGEWSYDVDKTGLAVGFDQKLESDSVRQAWAEKGGSLTGFEAGVGMSMMFQTLDMGGLGTSTMTGVGLEGSLGITALSLKPPDYETRGTKWTAWKTGLGMNFSTISITSEFTSSSSYVPSSTMEGTMTQLSVTGCIGFLTATGSFDSETEWSGFAIGVDWVPSIVKTSTTFDGVTTEGDATFNATGFAVNFESGSMKTMAESMAKEAHFKLRIFLLPPVNDLPLFFSVNAGWTWY